MKPATLFLELALALTFSAPTPPEPEKIPCLQGKTNYGFLTQEGRRFCIDGEYWRASGEIRGDGKVILTWFCPAVAKIAPGVYELKDGKLVGVWGWIDYAEIGDDGELTCLPYANTIELNKE